MCGGLPPPKKLDQNIKKNQDKTPCRKEQNLIDFGLRRTLDVNSYVSHSAFKFNLFKKCVK